MCFIPLVPHLNSDLKQMIYYWTFTILGMPILKGEARSLITAIKSHYNTVITENLPRKVGVIRAANENQVHINVYGFY